MKLPYSTPEPAGSARARAAKKIRDLATEMSGLRPHALTRANSEENDHNPTYPANFTKGLLHDCNGILANASDYRCLVEAINSSDRNLFEKHVETAQTRGVKYHYHSKRLCGETEVVEWRGWESPRAGHVYELEGPDPGAVGMAPAPRVGSSELAAEMAEVYALALLRDVPFTEICAGGDKKLCPSTTSPGKAKLSATQIVACLNSMPFYSGKGRKSSTPHSVDHSGLNRFERNRRFARTLSADGKLTPENAFRGSTKGAHKGPYVSQFMLIGARSIACEGDGKSNHPGINASFDLQDGFIPYGSLTIDQRTITHKNCLDYMTDWWSWLDVQNGAAFNGADAWEPKRRFITTPRDLATYVHYDALYEAYLNACMIMQAMGVPASKGFPEKSPSGHRTAFATFGGPHILTLVTEVATRCLKAVRRQKFNYHRRARPEAIGGRLTLACLLKSDKKINEAFGCAGHVFGHTLKELPSAILEAIATHNQHQNSTAMANMRNITHGAHSSYECFSKDDDYVPKALKTNDLGTCNYLLPMAFPEGSPMHPAYGAGHATVAGGCVTMLKAFFEMFEDCDSGQERKLVDGNGDPIVLVPNHDGSKLVADKKSKEALTIQGELDKLAANISIGRNMAGVHYHSDYFDSLRMGERVAVGILMEQMPTYGDDVETTFKSFDGDMMSLSTQQSGGAASLSIMDGEGNPVDPRDWWLRHVSGEQITEDS